MSSEALEAVRVAEKAAASPAAKMSGVTGALLALVAWIKSVERRMAAIEER